MKGEEARHQGQASIIIIVLIWKLHSMLRCAPSLPVSLESQHLRAPHIPVTILHRSQPSHNVPLLKVFLFMKCYFAGDPRVSCIWKKGIQIIGDPLLPLWITNVVIQFDSKHTMLKMDHHYGDPFYLYPKSEAIYTYLLYSLTLRA